MTTRLGGSGALVVLAASALFAGCGSGGTTKTTSTLPPSAPTAATSPTSATTIASTAPSSSGPVTVKGKLGDTLKLVGAGLNANPNDHRKTKVEVTVTGLSGPFHGYDVAKGRKLIGVKLHFLNIGALPYGDPLPSGDLVVTGGETGKQTNLIQLQGSNPCDDPSVKLKTGQVKNVCIAYDVPLQSRPQTFQYVTDSGYGDTGLWRLTG